MRPGRLVGTPLQIDPSKGDVDTRSAQAIHPPKGMHRPGARDCPTRLRSPSRATPRDQESGARCRHTDVRHTKEGLRNPHSVTRNPALPANSLSLPRNPHTPEGAKLLGHTGVRAPRFYSASRNRRRWAPDRARTTMTPSPKSATTTRGPKGGRLINIIGHGLPLWYSVPDSVHCSRASVLPRPGLARDPTGVALAAPIPHGPRAGR